MMNRAVVTNCDDNYDARNLRVKLAELLIMALDEGAIEAVTECRKRKRRIDTDKKEKRRRSILEASHGDTIVVAL